MKVFISDLVRRSISQDPYEYLLWKDIAAGTAAGIAQVCFFLYVFILLFLDLFSFQFLYCDLFFLYEYC
ncbi:hypothetical protein M1146_06295 [Patescibacteria group bacterium]|nr:hypothetical protein [Patescibacteria group bacterium]